MMNSVFVYLGLFNFSFILKHSFAGYRISVDKFFFQYFEYVIIPLPSDLCSFWWEMYMMNFFSLTAFKIFSLSFDSLIMICLGVELFGIDTRSSLSLWMCRLMCLIKLAKFSAIIFANILLLLYFSPFFLGTPFVCMLVYLMEETMLSS